MTWPAVDAAAPGAALEGLKIVDFSRAFAGPLCTMLLAEMGADVIKVERPGVGDETRTWPPLLDGNLSGYFAALNRSKRSVTLDLKHPRAALVAHDLAAWADVVVENFRPGVADRLGIGYRALSATHPALVYCSISGFGQTGPYRDRAGYDPVLQAMGGFMGVTGEKGGDPIKSMIPVADVTAGLFAVIGILTAIAHRTRTGTGQYVDLGMLDAMVSITSTVGSFYLNTGHVPERSGRDNPVRVPSTALQCAGGAFLQLVPNQLQWPRFCEAIGAPDLAADERFHDNAARIRNQDSLYVRLREIFLLKDSDEWYRILVNAGIPAGPIHTLDTLFADPQVLARQMVADIECGDGLNLKAIKMPLRMSATPSRIRSAPPRLGEHTADVLTEVLGYSDDLTGALSTQGAI